MPYINTTTTARIDEEKRRALTEKFGRAIELLPEKSEKWLMLNFTDEANMAFRGDEKTPLAMLEVKILGSAEESAKAALTAALTEAVSRTLGVASDRIYVCYSEHDTWGYNGENL